MAVNVTNSSISDQINQLFSSILEEQEKYMQVKEGNPEKKELIADKLKEFENARGRGFFYNYLASGKGHGPFTELIDDSIKYDMIGGIGPNLLGHSHPLYIKAHLEAATSDTIMCGNLLPYQEALDVTKAITDAVKDSKLKYFWFTGSGSFANDTALKMIWQKAAPKYKIFAMEKAFAGRSVATQDITHNEAYRKGMPQSIEVTHVPHFDQENPDKALEKTLSALNKAYDQDPDSYGAIMLEVIQGEGGFIYGPKSYYESVFKWAKEKGLYIWIDEVQTFARTKSLFAFQMFELDEYVDIVTVGKALQCCGVLYSEELNPAPGLVAGTFNGAIATLKASEKILKFLLGGNFYGAKGRIEQLEQKFHSGLKEISQEVGEELIHNIGGVGTMICFEVLDSSKEKTVEFIKKLFDNGVISFLAGANPTRVRFLIPLTLTDDHINEILAIVKTTLNEMK